MHRLLSQLIRSRKNAALFLFAGGWVLSAVGCVRDGGEASAAAIAQGVAAAQFATETSGEVNVGMLPFWPHLAYLQDGFDVDNPLDRRVAGNFTRLAGAFHATSSHAPSPKTLSAFVATPEFAAVNLWDPFSETAGVLEEGPPPDDAQPGTYWTWVEKEERHFVAVTSTTVVLFRGEIEPEATSWSAPGADVSTPYPDGPKPANLDAILAYCRALVSVVYFTTPQIDPYSPGLVGGNSTPPLTLEELKGYWWLWDAEAMLEVPPLPLEDHAWHIHPMFGSERLYPGCLVDGEPVWMWGHLPERLIDGPRAKETLGIE
ncbi:hypothetical protein H8D30_04960 [bacterium]|nr:hypothetical protein [bacterium]